jgi:hypothetical protein
MIAWAMHVLLLLSATTAAEGLQHLRSLRDLPFPRTLGAAKSLHAEALRRARIIELQHGPGRIGERDRGFRGLT